MAETFIKKRPLSPIPRAGSAAQGDPVKWAMSRVDDVTHPGAIRDMGATGTLSSDAPRRVGRTTTGWEINGEKGRSRSTWSG